MHYCSQKKKKKSEAGEIKMEMKCFACRISPSYAPYHFTTACRAETKPPPSATSSIPRRNALAAAASAVVLSTLPFVAANPASSSSSSSFFDLPDSGGVKALDLRLGTGAVPTDGNQKVAIHYYGRLGAKQGWRFDSTYDHKDANGEPVPFVFIIGSGKVISGIESAVKSMKVGGIRRVVIPPSQGYQNTSQQPLPPNAEAVHHNLQPHPPCQWRRIHSRNTHLRH
ncbi:Peptidyl-prolyl cis-trans isomerase FKBP17-1, chloroplastic [Linum grandiflorum]